MKSNRIRTILSLIWLVFTFSLVTWWFIFALKTLETEMASESTRHHRMFFYEGSTLLLTVLIGGIVMIVLSYRDDQRNQKMKFFFSNFTHEIKTSITRIRLQADILKEDGSSKNNRILQRLLNDISKLDLQLENSLLLTHVDKSFLLNEKIIFSEMLQSIQFEFEDLKIHIQGEASLLGDSRALKSIFRNLFENSRRHGKAAEVFCEVAASTKDLIQITVQDHGQGSQRSLSSLGKKILSTSDNQGSGVGLYLAKQLIKKMNGQIHFKSEPNKGFQTALILKGKIL